MQIKNISKRKKVQKRSTASSANLFSKYSWQPVSDEIVLIFVISVAAGNTRYFLFDPHNFGIKPWAGLEGLVVQIKPTGCQFKTTVASLVHVHLWPQKTEAAVLIHSPKAIVRSPHTPLPLPVPDAPQRLCHLSISGFGRIRAVSHSTVHTEWKGAEPEWSSVEPQCLWCCCCGISGLHTMRAKNVFTTCLSGCAEAQCGQVNNSMPCLICW